MYEPTKSLKSLKLFPDIPADHIAENISDSVTDSQSFRFGNRNAQQRARMRRDFAANFQSVLANNFGETIETATVNEQVATLIKNLLKYFRLETTKELTMAFDVEDEATWRAELKNVVLYSYRHRDLKPAIRQFKKTIDYYVLQRDIIYAVNRGYRNFILRWKIGGLVFLGVIIATFFWLF